MLNVIDPLTDPQAHGGNADDASTDSHRAPRTGSTSTTRGTAR
jgi:hypothetical protein